LPYLDIAKRFFYRSTPARLPSAPVLPEVLSRSNLWHGGHAARRGTGDELVPPRRAGRNDSGHPSPCKRVHDQQVLHQECSRWHPRGDGEARTAREGNEPPTEALQREILWKWQTKWQTPNLLQSSKRLVYWRLNLVAAGGLEPPTYGLW